jgi:eukaryotic-like serine/threonine-protein kinase
MPRTPRSAPGEVSDRPDRMLNRYRLIELLASGGTAQVWRAVDEQLGRPVAVKLLHPHLLPDETSRLRLAVEARAAASLSHPGIGAVYDVSTDPANPALVMELIDGEPLSIRLRRDGPMEPRDAVRLIAEVAEALYHAHQRGVIHRDVKPGNILVERESGRARLIDFGIAHSLAPDAAALTETGTSPGTPRYMAPEQLAGERLGPRTDLWPLGAVLFECLTGRPAFDGPTAVAIARAQLTGAPSTDGLDPALGALIIACLAPDVAARPLHAGAMAAALRNWLDGDPSAAANGAPGQRGRVAEDVTQTTLAAVPAFAIAPPQPAEPNEAEDGGPRRSLGPIAAAVAVLVLAAGGVLAAVAPWDGGDATALSPSADAATPLPTPDWVTPLRDAYAAACGEPLPAGLIGLGPEEGKERVEDLVDECREEDDDDDDDEGRGNGNEGNEGGGNGNEGNEGRGGGNGGNGDREGRGRGDD